MENNIVAGIDIGTNTILMLIAEINENSFKVVQDYHSIARLGEGLDKTKKISYEAELRGSKILEHYFEETKNLKVSKIKAVATSAMRDATNSLLIKEKFENILQNEINIISGEEEAQLCFKGSIETDSHTNIIDIGGGSTEFMTGKNFSLLDRFSLNIGAVRLSEQFGFMQNINQNVTVNKVKKYLRDTFTKSDFTKFSDNIVAVAGTPTSLASISLGLNKYDPDLVHNHILDKLELQEIFEMIINTPKSELINNYNIHPNRVDILPAGTLILIEFMDFLGIDTFKTSIKGLRYGVVSSFE